MSDNGEFAIEPVRGLPEAPPEGERILWQGAPETWPLARAALGTAWVGGYFAALAGWRGAVVGLSEGALAGAATASWYLAIGALAIGVLTGIAWVTARATVYTLTSERVVMRIGAALTVTLNLPYRWIDSADLRMNRDGTGSIELDLKGESKVSYFVLWPHVRPWAIIRPRPALRCLRDARTVATILAAAARAKVTELTVATESTAVGASPHPIAAE